MDEEFRKRVFNRIRKFTIIILVCIPFVIGIVAFGTNVSINDESGDYRNWVSLVIELALGLIITISILIYSDYNQKKISVIIENICYHRKYP